MEVPLSEMPQLAREVVARLPEAHLKRAFLLVLKGELGAGKTTFMQHFAHALGIDEPVQSPTFVLMKTYPIAVKGYRKLVHIDAYRLEGAEEFQPLKPAQFLGDPEAIVCVEWPEKVGEALPAPDLTLRFAHTGKEGVRDVALEG